MSKSIRVSVVGATGYTGGELLRYLIRHPEVQVTHVTTENYAGQPIHNIHKFLKGRLGLTGETLHIPTVANDSDLVFLGLPHGAAARTAAAFLKHNVRVIDLSADCRIRNLKVYEKWYGKHPVPALLKEAVYGLPERYRDPIRTARLVANPGCYATASILAGLPLAAHAAWGKAPVIVDAASGVSGAGRKLENSLLFSEADESMMAYSLKGHRHQPEIAQEWQAAVGTAAKRRSARVVPQLILTTHLAPLNRGIFATLYAPLAKPMTAEALRDLYLSYYMREPFVSVLDAYESPEIKAVTYTNHCQIGLSVDPTGHTAIVFSTLDNLVKGASGQAVQNMNLMFGLDETMGLL